MTSVYPSVISASNGTGSSFQGIIDAFNNVRTANGEAYRPYPASFQGIIQAITDLQKWGHADTGDNPPNWYPIYDDEGNVIGGDFAPPPKNGDLWFDTRQGRLFIWMDDGYYQCNGADGIPTVSSSQPDKEVTGALWFNTGNQALYLYDGNGWVQVTAPTGFSTQNLFLTNPTTSTFNSPGDTLPDAAAVSTQEDYNQFIYAALAALEGAVEGVNEAQPLPMGPDTPPTATDGDQFYNTTSETLLVYSGGAWNPAGGPAPDISNYPVIEGLEQAIANSDAIRQEIQNRLSTLEGQPRKTYSLTSAGTQIILSDNHNNEDRVTFAGAGGITVGKSGNEMVVSASNLSASISAIENDYLTSADRLNLVQKDDQQQSDIDALTLATNANTANVGSILDAIDALPTASELAERLSSAGGTLTGNLSMGGNLITDLPDPSNSQDATTRGFEDDREVRVRNDLVAKVGTTLQSIKMNNSNLSLAGLDFSTQPINGNNAFKFQTYQGGNPHYVTFGTTDKPWEYSWKYSGDEAFNWIRNGQRVFAIQGEEVYAKDFVLASLGESADGPRYSNKINIRDVINDLQQSSFATETQIQNMSSDVSAATTGVAANVTAIAALNSSVSALSRQVQGFETNMQTVTYDKSIHYGDTAPTENVNNGDIWFDSDTLRLNVRHYGTWVYPDRVEDFQLKHDLLEAVEQSTDFQSLKIKLMAALI